MLHNVRQRLLPAVALATLLMAALAVASAENIDPINDNSQFAWGENVGWINAEPSGSGGPGIQVSYNKLTGYMYGENIGWINLSCSNNGTCGSTGNYGVTNDGVGNLGGYAWGENVGWISFCDQDTPGTCNIGGASTYRVVIDPLTGIFSGFAYGENIGWISFSDTAPVAYKVQTDDGDGIAGAIDNCDFDDNAAQTNTDAAPITTAGMPPAPPDNTVANSDGFGDVCDDDDDNDNVADANEAAGCNGSGALSATNADTDDDRIRDGAECALGSNPNNVTSVPPTCASLAQLDTDNDRLCDPFEVSIGSNPALIDTDGDKIGDGVEYRGYTTSPTITNSDGDTGVSVGQCTDNIEITSMDGNTITNSTDLLIVAQSFNSLTRANQDVDKNTIVNSTDLLIVAQNFNLFC